MKTYIVKEENKLLIRTYRIKEVNKLFTIQILSEKTTGVLWWKKTINVWKNVDIFGNELFHYRIGRYRLGNLRRLQPFTSLKKAKKQIEIFEMGVKYYE